MNRFTITAPICAFPVRCPRDGAEHQAIAKAHVAPNQGATFLLVECHGSYECAECQKCLNCLRRSFWDGQMPQEFLHPLDPQLLPAWQA